MIRAEVADLVVFSYNRPLQLYAFLESVENLVQGVGEITVIYRASQKGYYDYGYELVAQDFPRVKFVVQGGNPKGDFKPLTLQAVFGSPSKYVMFAVDDIVVKDKVNLAECIQFLEDAGAYGFYLRLGMNLNYCYTMGKAQPVPELKAVADGVYLWRFNKAELDWAYPNTVDMTVFRKKDISNNLHTLDYTSPNTLEGAWAGKAKSVIDRKGLCFAQSKVVNLPLNRVQTDWHNLSMEISPEDLQIKFLQGFKFDIAPLFKIQNRSAHMDYKPTFVLRAARNSLLAPEASTEPEKKKEEAPGEKESVIEKSEKIEEKHIVVVTASYKNADWYTWNLDSVFDQNYANWHMIYIDDCSPDGTGELVREYVKQRGFEDKVTILENKNRRKALANLYTAIMMCDAHDIIAILDGDDRFASENVLNVVNDMYSNHDVWLTYGQFKEYPNGRIGFCKNYPKEVVDLGAFRNYPMGPSHLRTFYAGLFHKIKIEDLIYEGDFFPMTYDLAIMFPMIEMAREHFMFCPTPLVEYNTANQINDHKVSKELQQACDRIVRSRGQYSKLEKLF